MQEVWVVDHGTRSGLGVMSLHPSAVAAAAQLRAAFAKPFSVVWEPLDFSPSGYEAVLIGHFSAVPGFSPSHSACFAMQRWTIDGWSF
jgi:hypothetical protein